MKSRTRQTVIIGVLDDESPRLLLLYADRQRFRHLILEGRLVLHLSIFAWRKRRRRQVPVRSMATGTSFELRRPPFRRFSGFPQSIRRQGLQKPRRLRLPPQSSSRTPQPEASTQERI